MQDNPTNRGSFNCADFDALLLDAIDGTLTQEQMARFQSHALECGDCRPLFEQAQAGMQWLKVLPQVEPPVHLLHNILAATTMTEPSAQKAGDPGKSWLRRASDWVSPQIAPAFQSIMRPRFAMTGAMAFFSVTMLLNVTGVKLSNLKNLDLRPSAISTAATMQYHQTTARVVRYYENIRLVYQLEAWSKKRPDGGGSEAGQGKDQKDQKQKAPGSNTTERPRKNDEKNQNYVMDKDGSVLAGDYNKERTVNNNDDHLPVETFYVLNRRDS